MPKMRIYGGKWKGRALSFRLEKGMRPTQNRVREAVFNLLDHRVKNWEDFEVWDLYAGTGALGIEVLSRGAKKVFFVEKNQALLRQLRKNLDTLEVPSTRYQLVRGFVLPWVKKQPESPSLVLMDPPYEEKTTSSLLCLLKEKALKDTVVVLEHSSFHPPQMGEGLEPSLLKKYGTTSIGVWFWG